jgi:hypothetical protein
MHPGSCDLVLDLTDSLRRQPGMVPDVTGDRAAEVAARHGAVHLGLATVVAASVARELSCPVTTVVAVALGTAAALLPDLPMPACYADAILADQRREYRYPAGFSATTTVRDHHFLLTEGPVPDAPDFSANGLVAAFPGGVAVRTGSDQPVYVSVRVERDVPEEVDSRSWDEVVDISWTAATGAARLDGNSHHRSTTPPWPGDYRVRVHADGRDGDDHERYELIVWAAPAAPEVVHKRTDRLGHRLRGEAEPPVVVHPWDVYHWVEDHDALTIAVVTGMSADDVLRAFDDDPAVAVLELDGAVLVVEDNGYHGSDVDLLGVLSANGRAASMFWNVNAVTQLSFAERGELLGAWEVGIEEPPDELAPLVADLDLADYRYCDAKGVTAVTRFTGHDIDPERVATVLRRISP